MSAALKGFSQVARGLEDADMFYQRLPVRLAGAPWFDLPATKG
jgi:hypothetical protein